MKSVKSLLKSFRHAFSGVIYCVQHERNFRIHIVIALYTLYFLNFYNPEKSLYILIILIIGLVLALEAINTSIEQLADKAVPQYCLQIKQVKDIAAAAVLIISIAALCAGVAIFYDIGILKSIFGYFKSAYYRIGILAVSAVISILFIFSEDIFKSDK